MPRGRPVNSKNRKGHSAGGRREGAGRKSAAQKEQEAAERRARQDRMQQQREEQRRNNEEARAEMQRQRKERLEQQAKDCIAALLRTATDQRIRDEHRVEDIEFDIDENGDIIVAADGDDDDDYAAAAAADGEHAFSSDAEDEVADYETEDEGEGPTKKRRARVRTAYDPPKDSPIGKMLDDTKSKVARTVRNGVFGTGINLKQMWIPPGENPLAFGNIVGPEKHYQNNHWQFLWKPLQQFKHYVRLNNVGCIHGCDAGSLETKGMRWRPMIKYDEIVWVLHDRIRCKCCGKYTSTIDPRFLAQLPTIVAEQLPFITTAAGPGIHRSMLYMLNRLKTRQMLEGSFANMIHEIQRISYDQNRASYFDCIGETAAMDNAGHFGQSTRVPYSEFNRYGHHNGIKATTAMFKAATNSYMMAHERYFQDSFQLQCDDMIATDHTHKFGDGVRASGRPGKVFTASFTGIGGIGPANFARLTFTKSNAELFPFIGSWHLARKNANAGPLKRHDTDNMAGDHSLFNHPSTFKDELQDGVVHRRPTKGNCLQATVPDDSWTYANTKESIQNLFLAALDEYGQDIDVQHVGVDCEWNRGSDVTSTVVVSLKGKKAWLCDLFNAGILMPDDVPSAMKQFFEHEKIIPVGVNISSDISRLAALGITIERYVELRRLAKLIDPSMKTGLDILAEEFLGIAVDKWGQDTDWQESPTLSVDKQKYAVIDGFVSQMLYPALMRKLRSTGKVDESDMIEAPDGLREGLTVEYTQSRQVVAIAEIVFVGGNGPVQKWGNRTIGSKMALVKLTEVRNGSARPPFSYDTNENDPNAPPGWDKKDKTLSNILEGETEPIIAVSTASLRLILGDGQPTIDDFYPLEVRTNASDANGDSECAMDVDPSSSNGTTHAAPHSDEEMLDLTDAGVICADDAAAGIAGSGPLVLEIDDDEDDDAPRSRGKEDIFHQFKDLPMKKSCSGRHIVQELNILATFDMDQERFESYKAHLAKEKKIDTLPELMDDFLHNKEEWRQHIPMLVPQANAHAARIRAVHSVMQADEELSKYYTPELKEYYEKFVDKILRGYFEELEDVVMHKQVGFDQYGLPIFIRKRGTVRAENFHQKMRVALGPWGIGARSAHYLLVLLTYRYNVATNIRRRGYHDFGHSELYLIDRIQTRIREIYNVIIYPLHQNQMEFKALDLVLVGIGPLSYDSDFVEKGRPSPVLKGDLFFIADSMGLVLPLQPIASREEIKIFTAFMLEHPKPSDSNFRELAKIYKEKADGVNIFPKLPTMVKAYYNRWKKNQEIKASRRNLGSAVTELREKLFKSSASIEQFHPEEVINSLQNAPNDASVPPVALLTDAQRDQEPSASNFVPPVQAPTQKQHVPVHSKTSGHKCAWAPFCKNTREVCGGVKRSSCKFRENFKHVTDEQLKEAKREMRNEEKRKRYEQQQEVNETTTTP